MFLMPTEQIYEDYWFFTLAWTDFNGSRFLNALRIVVNFIKEHQPVVYSKELYEDLQKNLQRLLGIDLISIRKGINQLVKMGFINSFLASYHPLAEDYLAATTDNERKLILSKIIYTNSSFKRSVTVDSNDNEIGFLVRTLEHTEQLNDKYICAIMTVNLADYAEGYIPLEKLQELAANPDVEEFSRRKYNQISYLSNLLGKLDGISYSDHIYRIATENDSIVSDVVQTKKRDSYLQRIYKRQLEEEYATICGSRPPKCMVENLAYPVLIASHIKPYIKCTPEEEFDPKNGLLLSKNIDSLFDLKYISFDDEGKVILYKRLSEDVKQYLQKTDCCIDPRFLNSKRKLYLAEHRRLCEQANL